jgi:hypothetical protein
LKSPQRLGSPLAGGAEPDRCRLNQSGSSGLLSFRKQGKSDANG